MGCIYTTLRRTRVQTATIQEREVEFTTEYITTTAQCAAPSPPKRRNAVVDIHNTSGLLNLQRANADFGLNSRWQNPMLADAVSDARGVLTEKSAVCDKAFLAKITAQFGL